MGSNPLYCDCHMRWLAEWVKKDSDVEPGIARCMEPLAMKEKLLLTAPASAFVCKSKYQINVPKKNLDRNKNTEKKIFKLKVREIRLFSLIFLVQTLGTVLKLLNNRRHFFRAAKQQPAEVLAKCDVCYTYPCQNSGLCEALQDREFHCKCSPGYHGDRCQHKIDACYGNPCRNAGTCKVLEEGRFR